MLTYVVFDFDGTLADSLPVVARLYNELAERHGFGRLSADNLEELRTLSILDRCKRMGIPPYRLPGLVVQMGRSLRGAMTSIPFHEGIPELLRELKARGHALFILSTNKEENIRAFLKHHSAEHLVDGIHCSSSLFGKARLLRALMKANRLQPGQLVYVGDEHRDVVACREVGVRVIAVRWGADAEPRLRDAGPDFLADTPADVLEWVRRWSEDAPAGS